MTEVYGISGSSGTSSGMGSGQFGIIKWPYVGMVKRAKKDLCLDFIGY